jgi:hypothetical protein
MGASEAELTWTAADRAMTSAQDADQPLALNGAAWTLGHGAAVGR